MGPEPEGAATVRSDHLEAAEPALQAPVEDGNAGFGLGHPDTVDEHSHGERG